MYVNWGISKRVGGMDKECMSKGVCPGICWRDMSKVVCPGCMSKGICQGGRGYG